MAPGRGRAADTRLLGNAPTGFVCRRAHADGLFARRHRPRDDVPDIFWNTVNGKVVEVGLLVAVVGAAEVDQAGDEVAGLQVAGLENRGFHLHANEASAKIDNDVVLGRVAYRLGELVAEFGGFGHETKLGPLASLFVVADIHAGSFHGVPRVAEYVIQIEKARPVGHAFIFDSTFRIAFSRG